MVAHKYLLMEWKINADVFLDSCGFYESPAELIKVSFFPKFKYIIDTWIENSKNKESKKMMEQRRW